MEKASSRPYSEPLNGKIHFDIDKNDYCPIGEKLSMAMCTDITEKGDGGVMKQINTEGSGGLPKKGSKIYGEITLRFKCFLYLDSYLYQIEVFF
jgi:hypothetical protein